MRVALVDPLSFTPPYDHALATALARRGHDVTLLASPFLHGEVPEPDGYEREEVFLPLSGRVLGRWPRSPLRLPLKAAEYAPSMGRLLSRLGALGPDVVHVQWLPRPEFDRRWVRRLERPSVLTAHDVVPRRERALPAWRQALQLVDRVIVHSQGAAEQLRELNPVVIRHPVFEHAPLGPPHGQTLLFFGLLRDYKGLDLLVRALPWISEARLVVAGDPFDPIEPVQALATKLGVADRVDWRLRFVGDDEARELMENAAVVVLPYRKLDSSGVLATAIGYRRPVVVSDVGSLGEIVREFGAGLVVPPDDDAALAAACSSLLEDQQALARAYEGAARAAASLTWDAAAQEHERVYEEIRSTNRPEL
jgi:glycosyltransferase involved in cell wall biosynthesis